MNPRRRSLGPLRIPLPRVHIELTNICDFDCVFCPKSLMTRPCGRMDPALARRLLDEIRTLGLAEKVTFHVMGEPTLHPDFFGLLDYAKEIGMPVGLTTNAGGLGGSIGRKLLDYGLHQVDLSLQTPDRDSFALRKAGRLAFEEYQDGIIRFAAAYRKRWPDTVFKFRFLNTLFPSRAIEEKQGPVRVISSTRDLQKVFSLWTEKIFVLMGEPDEKLRHTWDKIRSLRAWQWNVVEILPRIFFETYMLSDWGNAFSGGKVREAWAGYCFGMRDHFSILWNGDLSLCCLDFDGKAVIGNLREKSLEEILRGPVLAKVMKGFRRLKPVLPYCRRCLGSRGFFSWLTRPFLQVAGLTLLKPFFYRKTRLTGR